MKIIILILCLFFLFSTSLNAKEGKICEWIITDGDYQEYLDDLPLSDFYSAFHVVVGNDGRCSYGWDWRKTNKPIEQVIQLSFNDCEEWRIKKNIDGGECKPYDVNTKIVWGKPELYEELAGSKMKTSEEMIAASSLNECNFDSGFKDYQEWVKTNNKQSSYLFVVNKVNSAAYCNYGYGVTEIDAFAICENYRKKFAVDEKCEVYAVGNDIVFEKPELYEKLAGSKMKTSEEMIAAIAASSEEACEWIFSEGYYQEYLDDLPPSDFHSAFYIVVGTHIDGYKDCTYAWRRDNDTQLITNLTEKVKADCDKYKLDFKIEGECRPYDINAKIVWGKPELYAELTKSILGDSILELENSECREFFLENFNDYKSTDNKFFFTVESEGRCEYGMGHDADSAFNDCEKFRQENNIGGMCEPYAVEDQIVWGKPELYAELVAASSSNKAKSCDDIKTSGEYRDEINSFPNLNFVFWVITDDDVWCESGGRTRYEMKFIDVIKSGFRDCEEDRKSRNAKGECKPFALNKKIVWNKPELYEELTGSKLKPSEEIQKSLDEGDYDSVDVGLWQLDDTINSKDPSTLQKVIYIGEEKRNILEARVDREDHSRRFEFKATPYVFDAYYENGKIFEILIYFENKKNKSKGKAESLAEKYAFMIGQMPNVLLQRLDAAHIYADVLGISNASAHRRVINIHPEGEDGHNFGNAIEELFIHELVHASLDKPIHGTYQALNKKRHKNTTTKSKKLNWGDWRQAVKKDKKKYITEYAKTTIHEDLAESFTAWLALRYKGDRISNFQKQLIENKIPNRIKFFDEQQFDMHPLVLNN